MRKAEQAFRKSISSPVPCGSWADFPYYIPASGRRKPVFLGCALPLPMKFEPYSWDMTPQSNGWSGDAEPGEDFKEFLLVGSGKAEGQDERQRNAPQIKENVTD